MKGSRSTFRGNPSYERCDPRKYEVAKSILHHLNIDDRDPYGRAKVVYSSELKAYVIRATDLYPALELHVSPHPIFEGDC